MKKPEKKKIRPGASSVHTQSVELGKKIGYNQAVDDFEEWLVEHDKWLHEWYNKKHFEDVENKNILHGGAYFTPKDLKEGKWE